MSPIPFTTASFRDVIAQGADYDLAILDRQPDHSATDLSGCTARFQLRRNADDPVATVDLNSEPSAGLSLTAVEGRIDLHLTAEQTRALSGTYLGHLELTWPGGRVDRLLEATLTVSPEIVR